MTRNLKCPMCGATLPLSGERVATCSSCGQEVPVPKWRGVPPPAADDTEHAPLDDEHALDPMALMPSKALHPEDLIDMTAMVDIVFFLLIFFLVTSMQALVAVMDMPPAHAPQSAAGKAQSVSDMQADPEFLVVKIEDDDSIWIEDEQVFGEQDLGAKLRGERAKDDERRSILILGSADASHGASVAVFDACMDAGFDDIRLSVQEQLDAGIP